MSAIDTNLLLQCAASIVWAAAGATVLRTAADSQHEHRQQRRSLGVALIVGATLQAIDGLLVSHSGLPLAALALTVFLGFSALGAQLRTIGIVALAAATWFALHWAHAASPQQPIVAWPMPWRPLDLAVALTIGWLAWRSRQQFARDGGMLVLSTATAIGLGCAAFAGRYAEAIAAGSMLFGVLPVLFGAARTQLVTCCAATAAAFTVVLTAALRAGALHEGTQLRMAGIDDPLLVLVMLQLVTGAALWQALGKQKPAAGPVQTVANTDTSPSLLRTGLHGQHSALGAPAIASPTDLPPAHTLVSADIVRELRTPLTNLVAAVDLAAAGNDRSELNELTGQLQAYAQQMTTAMSDIGELENLLRGEIELAEDVYDLPQLLRNCVVEVTPFAAERDVELRLDIASSTPQWVQGDPARTRQLFSRTLRLAAQTCAIGPIDVSLSATVDQLHMVVLNQHAGADQPDWLGSFFATELARVMGGTLEHQAQATGGSQLHLSLPKQLPPDWEIELLAKDAETSQPRAESAHLVQGTVMLVTNNADHRKLLARLLGNAGAEVSTADSGDLAMHMLSNSTADLVLVDMQMLDDDPLTTVRRLRAEGVETPIMAISTDSSPQQLECYLAAGCNGHLAKPVDSEQLRRALTMHLAPAT